MKKTLTILALALAVGCVPADDKNTNTDDNNIAPCGECEENNNPRESAELKGSFISGHLGNYWDCPDQGYSPDASSEAPGARPAGDEGFCAPAENGDAANGCGGPLNCEGAQLTIRLTNGGDADATSIDVSKIEIFDADGVSLTTLPVLAVFDSSTNESFDGQLAAGESIDLRVDYNGPADLYSLLPEDETGSRVAGSDSAFIEITVEADNHDDVVIDGGEVFVLPMVVT